MERRLYILTIALDAVIANKFRSILTALGIIFGVAAVIAMLAIGSGARQEILDQMKLVGVNNIIITPKVETEQEKTKKEEEEKGKTATEKFSPGLTLKDAESIKEIIPSVAKVSPEVIYESVIIAEGTSTYGKVSGVTPDFFDVFTLTLEKGEMFNEEQMIEGKAVCILGATIKNKLFPKSDPIGRYVKCGSVWLKVVGTLSNRAVTTEISQNMGISDYNNQVYTPIQTLLLRYKDRSVVTTSMVRGSSSMFVTDDFMSFSSSGPSGDEISNQIDKIVVQVKETSQVNQTTEILNRMFKRRHAGVEDFVVQVPELLLKQEQRTKDIFNIVLGAIASISLIVGGIGIMNIMLASVMERTKEIGIRMATGATKKDVIFQFLSEATMISLAGGIIGILLGIILSKIIMGLTGILTIVSLSSILISFGVSASVGIAFGYMPARKAAMQDPVTSLRYE